MRALPLTSISILLNSSISLAVADVAIGLGDIPVGVPTYSIETSAGAKGGNSVGEASYNIENCDDVPEDTGERNEGDAGLPAEPKDLDECKAMVE